MIYRKKLIEVALPLEAINKASARETRHCEERSDEAPPRMPRVLAVEPRHEYSRWYSRWQSPLGQLAMT